MAKLCLVTGACGFCGSHMVDLLVDEGYEVRATDLETADKKWLNPKAEFIPADLTKKRTLKGLLDNVSYVFHVASLLDFSAPWEALKKVNVDGMVNICEEALKANIERFILWSTMGVIDASNPQKIPLDENTPYKAVNDYEKSKIMQEKLAIKYYREKGLPATVIRPAPIYGPRNFYGVASVILPMAKLHFILAPFPIPSLLRNNHFVSVHVKDLCRAALFLAGKKEAIGEIYNAVDDSNYTMAEFLGFIAILLGKPIISLPMLPIPLHVPTLMRVANLAATVSEFVARRTGTRPLIERSTIDYIKYDFIFSNKKLKDLGFKFLYPDNRVGFIETINWYKKEGII